MYAQWGCGWKDDVYIGNLNPNLSKIIPAYNSQEVQLRLVFVDWLRATLSCIAEFLLHGSTI
jgi:hypothetical protein